MSLANSYLTRRPVSSAALSHPLHTRQEHETKESFRHLPSRAQTSLAGPLRKSKSGVYARNRNDIFRESGSYFLRAALHAIADHLDH